MRDVKVRLTCDVSGKVIPAVEHDLDDGEDFDAPVGWLEITVRRAMQNPEYAEALAAVRARRSALTAQVVAANPAVDRAALGAEIQGMVPDPDVPSIAVDEQTFHVSPDHADKLYRLLGVTP